MSSVKEFADLSEQELDRIEVLVQNLLKITKLDAGSIAFEKEIEKCGGYDAGFGAALCVSCQTGTERDRLIWCR